MRHEQGGQVVPPLAVHDGLVDALVGHEQPLDVGRDHLLAVGEDQQFLLAAGDGEEAVRVERAQVAGVEPAVADRLGGRLRGCSSSPS